MESTAPKWHHCAGRALAALTLLLGTACSEHAPPETPVETSPLARARAALTALAEQDGIEVAQCREIADRCSERFMGAAPAEICARQAQRCDALESRLSELREPALLCWQRSARRCAGAGAERAGCKETVTDCELGDSELSRAREPVLSCGERLEACLEQAAETGGSGAYCERLDASCGSPRQALSITSRPSASK